VVVGASEGLGEAFSLGLAKRGLNVVIVARNEEKLKAVAKKIESYNQRAKIVVANILHETFIGKLQQSLEDLEVTFLVNNAGGLCTNLGEFLNFSEKEMADTEKFNTGYLLQTIRLLLPKMVQKRFGAILNVGSLSSAGALYVIPYSSEKAKLNSLTESLSLEYEDYGVKIQCVLAGKILTPNFVNTFRSNSRESWDFPLPEVVSESALNLFGRGGPVIVPYWGHAIQAMIMCCPDVVRTWVIKTVYKGLKRDQK